MSAMMATRETPCCVALVMATPMSLQNFSRTGVLSLTTLSGGTAAFCFLDFLKAKNPHSLRDVRHQQRMPSSTRSGASPRGWLRLARSARPNRLAGRSRRKPADCHADGLRAAKFCLVRLTICALKASMIWSGAMPAFVAVLIAELSAASSSVWGLVVVVLIVGMRNIYAASTFTARRPFCWTCTSNSKRSPMAGSFSPAFSISLMCRK